MMVYSNPLKPIGRYNDPTGIDQYSMPSSGSVEKWKSMVDDDQTLYFAQRYLANLGKDTVTRLGYNYQDVLNTLYSRTVSTTRLYPWSIAIQPKSQWTFRQQFVSDLYFNRRKEGRIKGTLLTVGKYFKKAARSIRRELCCPDYL